MKKVFAITICLVVTAMMFTGCNQSIGFGNYEFRRVHIDTYHYSGCLTVEKWNDSESGIEVKTKEAGSMFLSEGTYIMMEGDKGCPLCKEKG